MALKTLKLPVWAFIISVFAAAAIATFTQPVYAQPAVTKPCCAVTGTVSYKEDITLSPKAVVIVKLVDASEPTTYIAQQTIKPEGGQMPFSFTLPYDVTMLDPSHAYLVKASISDGGGTMFHTTQDYHVITQGCPMSNVDIVLTKVAGAAPVATPPAKPSPTPKYRGK